MNNDNLKRVLNKISGAAQRLPEDQIEQTAPQPEDQIEETTPPPLTFQEKIKKYCACALNLIDRASILETQKDGWEAHVKWATTYCLSRIGVKLNGADPILVATFNCPGFIGSEAFGKCRLDCLSRGHIDPIPSDLHINTKPYVYKFFNCVVNCLNTAPSPPLIDNSGPGGSNLWGSFPWLYWQIRRFILLSPSYPDRPPLIW